MSVFNTLKRFLLVLLALPMAVASSQAATQPTAGSLLQNMEQSANVAPMVSEVPAAETATENTTEQASDETSEQDQAMVQIKSISWHGNDELSDQQLAAAVADYLKQPVSFAELQQLVQTTKDFYTAQGYMAQVWLPAQDVTEGQLQVHIREARFAGVQFTADSTDALANERVLAMIASRQQVGDLVRLPKLNRAQLLASDMPGVSVMGSFVAGEQEGTTALQLNVQTNADQQTSVTVDNHGSYATGEYRVALSVKKPQVRQMGDELSLSASLTEGSTFGQLNYRLPYGDNSEDGQQVQVTASLMEYKLVAGQAAGTDTKGSSNTLGVQSSWALQRSYTHNQNLTVDASHKAFLNKSSGNTQSDYSSTSAGVDWSGNYVDQKGLGGSTQYGLSLRVGDVALGSIQGGEDASLGGAFEKLTARYSRNQNLSTNNSLSFNVRGQYAWQQLDSSEKFFLGGASGVRAYPTSEIGGSKGLVANLALTHRFANQTSVSGFVDYGRAWDMSDDTSPEIMGAGLEWQLLDLAGMHVTATYARRIGDNPKAQAGMDADGTLIKDRFWVSMRKAF